MTALAQSRQTPERLGNILSITMAAGAHGFLGGMAQVNATGGGDAATATAANKTVGVFMADAGPGEAANVKKGIFAFANSAGADEITKANIGATCYVVDDQTVAKTSDTNARPAAGKVFDVDEYGVWVDFR
ncbi:hypothetical protein ED208_12635 [Stagnimonas aquatica]|uniref:DUF2190 domain-containing protein n=1 Tax=Stagnimonas aquatica TaxID=2689987 RepID=A0A3N0V7G6_9GAMM|nr:hypothetical protein [Stagnimonas aquatica]ROH88659.1 hypothetical protein ED208_12635 [Stagnimonas aquatica]